MLSPTNKQLGALGAEFRKGGRTGPIQIFTVEGFGDQSYRLPLKATLEKVEARLAELHQIRRAPQRAGLHDLIWEGQLQALLRSAQRPRGLTPVIGLQLRRADGDVLSGKE